MELSAEAQVRLIDIAWKMAEFTASKTVKQEKEETVQQYMDNRIGNFGYAYTSLLKSMGYKQTP